MMKIINPLLFLVVFFVSCGKDEGADEAIAEIRINDIAFTEGNSTKTVQFELTLAKASSREVRVTANTQDGSAVAGKDYVAVANEVIIFNPGEITKSFAVQITGNDIREAEKTFVVKISAPVNGFIVKGNGTAAIQNDDTKILIPATGYEAPDNYPGYTLVWSDEFNGNTLNTGSWSFEMGDGCPQLCGWGNNELQYYTNSTDNLYFQDGNMIIEARQETYSGKNYTSSRIKSAGKQSFKFGKIDIRAVLPTGKGIWPAIWMLPEPNAKGVWPTSGELDIMELIGSEPKKAHGTVHFGPGPGSTQISRSYTSDAGFQDAFHIFSLEWEEDEIRWYIDGNIFSTVKKEDMGSAVYPFNEPFYLLLNVAVGGNWPGQPDATTRFPQRMIVDYIRVYQ